MDAGSGKIDGEQLLSHQFMFASHTQHSPQNSQNSHIHGVAEFWSLPGMHEHSAHVIEK